MNDEKNISDEIDSESEDEEESNFKRIKRKYIMKSDEVNDSSKCGDEQDETDDEASDEPSEEDEKDQDEHSSKQMSLPSSSAQERDYCAICLGKMMGNIGSPEQCEHAFCLECILEWAKCNSSCPQDRIPFLRVFVRRRANGKIIKTIQIEEVKPYDIPPEEANEQPTYCEICGRCDREDELLLCDGCNLGYHLDCLTTPLSQVPVSEWFCSKCIELKRATNLSNRIFYSEAYDLLEDVDHILATHEARNSMNSATPRRRVPRTRASERVLGRITRARLLSGNRLYERLNAHLNLPSDSEDEEENTRRRRPGIKKKVSVQYEECRRKKRRAREKLAKANKKPNKKANRMAKAMANGKKTSLCDFEGCDILLYANDLHTSCLIHRVCFNTSSPSLVTSECPTCHSYFKGPDQLFMKFLKSLGKDKCCKNLQIKRLTFAPLFKECDFSSLNEFKQKFIKTGMRHCDFEGCEILLNCNDLHSACLKHRICFNTITHSLVKSECSTCLSYSDCPAFEFMEYLKSLVKDKCLRGIGSPRLKRYESLFKEYNLLSLSKVKQNYIREKTRFCDFEGCDILLNGNDLHTSCLIHRVCFNTSYPSLVTSECPTCHSYFKGPDQLFMKFLKSLGKDKCCKKLQIKRLTFAPLFKECDFSSLNEFKQKFIKTKSDWFCGFKGCETSLSPVDLHTACINHMTCFSKNSRSLRQSKCKTCRAYFTGDDERFKKWLISLENRSKNTRHQDIESNFGFLFRECGSSMLSESKQKMIKENLSTFSLEPTAGTSHTPNRAKGPKPGKRIRDDSSNQEVHCGSKKAKTTKNNLRGRIREVNEVGVSAKQDLYETKSDHHENPTANGVHNIGHRVNFGKENIRTENFGSKKKHPRISFNPN